MKAVRIERFGGLDEVVVEEVPVPVAGAGEILVRVLAAGVSSEPPPQRAGVQVVFFYAEATTSRLKCLNTLFENGTISARVGSVLPPEDARKAHLMLAGAAHKPGKIVLQSS